MRRRQAPSADPAPGRVLTSSPEQVENYARAFPDVHRELYRLYVSGDIVVVRRLFLAPRRWQPGGWFTRVWRITVIR
jgi:hypothetical protein